MHLVTGGPIFITPRPIRLITWTSFKVFLRYNGKLSSSIQVLHISRHRTKGWYDRFLRQVSALHVASYWGLDKAVAMLMKEEHEVDANH